MSGFNDKATIRRLRKHLYFSVSHFWRWKRRRAKCNIDYNYISACYERKGAPAKSPFWKRTSGHVFFLVYVHSETDIEVLSAEKTRQRLWFKLMYFFRNHYFRRIGHHRFSNLFYGSLQLQFVFAKKFYHCYCTNGVLIFSMIIKQFQGTKYVAPLMNGVQFSYSVHWTELNWTERSQDFERWTKKSGKNIQFSSQYIRGHKVQKCLQKGDKNIQKLNIFLFIYRGK